MYPTILPLPAGPTSVRLLAALGQPWAPALVLSVMAELGRELAAVGLALSDTGVSLETVAGGARQLAASPVRDPVGGQFRVVVLLEAVSVPGKGPLRVALRFEAHDLSGNLWHALEVGQSSCDQQSLDEHGLALALSDSVGLATSGLRRAGGAEGAHAFCAQLVDALAP